MHNLPSFPAHSFCNFERVYAIVDIATTGGNTNSDRIIEIAILLHDGKCVVEEFNTLINPGQRVPYRICSITGISNEMVAAAPPFYEVARKIVELTEHKILVAHNAKFDYNFIRNEFKSLGYEFKLEKVCIIEMSRTLLPGLTQFNLGGLGKTFGLQAKVKHRAFVDVQVTAQVFERLLLLQTENGAEVSELLGIRLGRLSPEANLHKELIDQLPRETGVYYFYNSEQQLIYIGKSVNIRSRVLSHFANNTTRKALEMKRSIAHIRFAITGSELVALLKESEEIKQNKPVFNRAQRRSRFNVGLFSVYDDAGYLTFYAERLRHNGPEPLSAFSSSGSAKSFLEHVLEEFELCQKKCQMQKGKGPCFHHMIHKCHGVCMGVEPPLAYNLRAEQVLNLLQYEHGNLLIIDKGREEGEKSLVLVENGKYRGYGFIEEELVGNDLALLRLSINSYMDNKDVRQIIKLYLRQEKAEQVLKF
ncbi:MAG TPA: DNA polymerase III subunit epsilon [Bacteroidetes bacterium]|nr:DNA polymerase III subunit epsilon [Bacteroidota bacterium]